MKLIELLIQEFGKGNSIDEMMNFSIECLPKRRIILYFKSNINFSVIRLWRS